MSRDDIPVSPEATADEVAELRVRLAEAEETLRAIREGEVDAIIVSGSRGDQVFSLSGTEHIYRLIIQTMREAALTVTLDGKILFCNSQFAEFVQAAPERIVGRALHEFVDSAQRPAVESLIQRSRHDSVKERLVFRGPEGGEVPAHVSASVLVEPDGLSICIVATDLTDLESSAQMLQELRRQQQALATSEKRYRTLVEALPQAIILHSEGRLIYANPTAIKLAGAASAPELVGRPVFDFVAPASRAIVEKHIQRVLSTGRASSVELKAKRLDGTTVEVEAVAVATEFEGRPAIQVVLQDITERKTLEHSLQRKGEELERLVGRRTADLDRSIQALRQEVERRKAAEQALTERSRLLDAFVRHIGTPLVFLDPQFNFIRVNEAYAKACARPLSDFEGRNHFELYPHAENQAIFEKVVREKEPYQAYGRPFTFPDHPEWGVTYWDWTLTPLLRDDGEVESLVFSLENVTERVRAERQLQALNTTLQARTQQLRRLASDLTLAEQRERHRLAQLLHDHLQQLLVGAKFRSAPLHQAQEPQVRQAAAEIDDLLNQSIAASRSLTAELSPPILHEAGLIHALEWLAGWMRENHGLEVETRLDHSAKPRSQDISVLLFQSVRELLFNVVKHSGVKEARLEAGHANGVVRLVVSDQGCGFDPAALRDGQEHGRGFGLLSIRERLDLLGGGLEISSAAGRGSRFTLHAPQGVAEDQPKAAVPPTLAQRRSPKAAGAVEPTRSDDHRISVLLVDDHAVTRQGLRRLLRDESRIRVVGEAVNGPAAIEMTRELQPDVVIMDVSMPGMSGIEATREIHGEFPEVRVIGLSMFAEDERGREMRQAGAEAYFTKSGPPQSLIDAIRNESSQAETAK